MDKLFGNIKDKKYIIINCSSFYIPTNVLFLIIIKAFVWYNLI